MLQQTQVTTVLPYFDRWMKTFPNFKVLAAARETKVIKLWEGLGYYSRARNLHKLAQAYVQTAQVPQTAAEWLTFPGIGPYTSAAIASIVYGESIAAIDGNVIRIIARLTADNTEFKHSAAALKLLSPLANKIISNSKSPGIHNQAMMELGATVCTKHSPQCSACPVSEYCQANGNGTVAMHPKLARRKIIRKTIDRVFAQHEGHLLLHKIPQQSIRLANFCELPAIADFIESEQLGELLASKSRGISNERIIENIYAYQPSAAMLATIERHKDYFWADARQLTRLTLSGPHKRWIHELLEM